MAEADAWAAWRQQQRRRLLALRQQIAPAQHQAWSSAIARRIIARLAPLHARSIGMYSPIHAEFNPLALADQLLAQGRSLALPAILAQGEPLEYRRWRPGEAMTEGPHGIPEPAARDIAAPELLLIPVLGFDDANHRLGYGGGYFDRTLAALRPRPLALGVGFEQGHLASLHPGPHDLALDAIITEARG
jgi:5,10-methenyltetrahydrofolate synthetase